MAYFQTKNRYLGKFGRDLQWKMLVFFGYLINFTAIWSILWQFGIFYGYSVYFSPFGMLCQEKSGNPAIKPCGRGANNVHRICIGTGNRFWIQEVA
jgi:hypothetical protein